MDAFPTSLQPLEGGYSGETFLADAAGEQVVLRLYGGRSAARGPRAPETDAALLNMLRGLLPVPQVLEVRAADDAGDLPGLLVTSRLPGERLDLLLPTLDEAARREVAAQLGLLVGRLGHMVQPRAGLFLDPSLALHDLPAQLRDLPAWVGFHESVLGWAEADLSALRDLAELAQDIVDADTRVCLVHGDLNPKNVLVDPVSLELTGLVDWEFAHAGSPYADLGNLLRFDREPVFVAAVLDSYSAFMPSCPHDLLVRARAADVFALVDLARRPSESPVAARAAELLLSMARAADLHAVP